MGTLVGPCTMYVCMYATDTFILKSGTNVPDLPSCYLGRVWVRSDGGTSASVVSVTVILSLREKYCFIIMSVDGNHKQLKQQNARYSPTVERLP